ncbi:MAG: apolipoprotein N-acyltransferase [Opitutales bacterium]|nr:apolipoprotein N-acyltransferase [Opitutales bacterium]
MSKSDDKSAGISASVRFVKQWITPALIAIWHVFAGVAAFPDFNLAELAWVFLVPWVIWAAQGPSLRRFLFAAWLSDAIRWFLLLFWLRHVTTVGTLFIAAVLSGFSVGWFALLHLSIPKLSRFGPGLRIAGYAGLAGLWVLVEWIRTQPWALPWAPLALSQWQRPALLGFTSVTGAWGISFLIVTVNVVLGVQFSRWLTRSTVRPIRRHLPETPMALLSIAGIAALSLLGGHGNDDSTLVKIVLVQPHQPAVREWTVPFMYESVERHFEEASRAANLDGDWMAWPEGALPWPLSGPNAIDHEVSEWVASTLRKPLLAGNRGYIDTSMVNAVYLFHGDGAKDRSLYAKRILVPFGEYIPFRNALKWVETIVPMGDGFVAGKTATVFPVEHKGMYIPVAPLICYEDCFPSLARKSVLAGADVFFVATYNVWYGEEHGAYQHAAHSVLRAAENRRPVFRCGSAGWSGWIDQNGVIREVLTDDRGSIYFRGSGTIQVGIPSDPQLTFYTRFGDWFVGLGTLLFFGWAFILYRYPVKTSTDQHSRVD